VYFLMEKSEAFSTFKSYKAIVEKELELTYGALEQTVGENLHHKNSPTSIMSMVFIDS